MSAPTRPSGQASPRAQQIVAAGRALLEEEGPAGLSMRRVAARVGVRAPSLYKHLADKPALVAAIVADALDEQAVLLEAALAGAPDDPLPALAAAYRGFAREHPHLYRLMNDGPLPRGVADAEAERRAVQPILQAVGGDPDLARAAWAMAHGLTMLELRGRFPPWADVEAAWAAGVAALRASLGGEEGGADNRT